MPKRDVLGNTTNITYDDAGRVLSKRLPDGALVRYEYDKEFILLDICADYPGKKEKDIRVKISCKRSFGILRLFSLLDSICLS